MPTPSKCERAAVPQPQHTPTTQKAKKLGRYAKLVQKYGPLVVVFHTTVWALVLGGTFVGLHHEDADIDFLLDYVPDSIVDDARKEQLLDAAHSVYGKFAIAYALTLATSPARLGITIVCTPWLSRVLTQLQSPFVDRWLLKNPLLERMLKDPLSFVPLLKRRPRDS